MFGIIVMMKEKLSSSRIFCSHDDDDELFVMIEIFLTATSMIYVNVCDGKKRRKEE